MKTVEKIEEMLEKLDPMRIEVCDTLPSPEMAESGTVYIQGDEMYTIVGKGEFLKFGQHETHEKGTLTSERIYASNIYTKAEIDDLLKSLNIHPSVEHKCRNCGGTVQLDWNKHIFACPYCGSVYAIGTERINDYV